MDIIIFKCALVVYLISTVAYIASLVVRRVGVARAATWVLAGAFGFHTAYIIIRWVHSGYSPVVNSFEALSFIAWAVSGVYLAFQARTRTRVLGAFVAPLALLLSIASSAGVIGAVHIHDTLKASWVTIHVVCSLVGGAFFALACCSSIMYLVQDNLIRKRRIDSLNRFLPPLRDLDRINHISAVWGFLLLTLGIIAGAVWARTVWGSHLQSDPKQIATLVSWIMCALLVHQRLAIGWKGKRAALLSIGAFVILLFAFVGVNMFFVTVHTF